MVTELAVAVLATVDLDEILLAQVECLRDQHGPAYLHGGPRRISQICDRVAGAGAYQAQRRADFAAVVVERLAGGFGRDRCCCCCCCCWSICF